MRRQCVLEQKMQCDHCLKRMESIGGHKVHAELWERCSKAVQAKIEARIDHTSIARNDPIQLLKASKEYSMCF